MRILCMGDSNTWGHDPKNGLRQEKRWTNILREMCQGDEIIEEGMNGRTLVFQDPHFKGRCGIDALPMLLYSHKPLDLVIIMLGTNDLKKIYRCGAKSIAKGVREFIKVIKNPYLYEGYDVPEILIISPILLGEGILAREGLYGDFDADSLAQSRQLAPYIKAICKTYGAHFMDAAKYAKASEIDAIHMDGENHRKLAEAIAAKLMELRK